MIQQSISYLRQFAPLALWIVFASIVPCEAQTITIRLLDAKSGKPLVDKNITVTWNNSFHIDGVVVRIGKDGSGKIDVPASAKSFSLDEGPKDGKEPYRIAYLDCNVKESSNPWPIVISDVLQRGVVPGNNCGKSKAQPKPGEVIFWGLTRPWYVPDMQ
jgi:hypothetical protein